MKRFILAAMLASGLAGAAHADDALKAAIAHSDRTPANVARDGARHPYETLSFFGIKPNMTVVELAPGGGWYTEILGSYLSEKGKLIAAGDPSSQSEGARRNFDSTTKMLASKPALFGKVQRAVFDPQAGVYQLGAPASADLVLTFRNVHNLSEDKAKGVFKAAHTVLKSGGVLGVVDHRMPAAKPADPKSGYVHEAYVIKLAESAGFKLAGKSEVNANPKDSADHEKGVWTLPPSLANKDVDRAKYVAIGESDRMTLKFVKK